jgi:putative sterol carrier protein
MPGLVAELLARAEKRQASLMKRLPDNIKAKLKAAEGRAAELKVLGDEGGLFYLKYYEGKLHLLDEPCVVRNKIVMKEDTFFDLIDGVISPRAAKAHRLIMVSGEEELYDTEELMQAVEDWLLEIRAILHPGMKAKGAK